jgi:hypothetical protein
VTLVEGGSAGMYLPSGHLVYARGGSFFAVAFDAARLKVLGPPVEVRRFAWQPLRDPHAYRGSRQAQR